VRFLNAVPWPLVLAVAGLFCLPLALGHAQRLAGAPREPAPSRLDEIAEVHTAFSREWDLLRDGAKDEQEWKALRREWRDRYDSALRRAYRNQGRDVPASLQPQGTEQTRR
jgi:hypothetical protein